ncbi:MAG: NAD(P)/FAD-dependent oxidoreductase, partial [Lachnospiraceae bacterium]|nr:NAD(P)/FAD-dependent oxidoreductase [Lachnospiraceae bacterium]
GIFSAGTAQRFVNVEGKMPGKEVVILGSGDIGLIMARRMTLEGAKVKAVAEVMPYSGGLKRNIVQCLNDFNIPLKLSHTVVDIKGKERVEGVTIAEVDERRRPIPGTEEYIPCDTLLLSVGLIPENELTNGAGIAMDGVTSGPVVDESLETDAEGIFACGNVLHVHDLVDFVSEEAGNAGRHAAEYVKSAKEGKGERAGKTVPIKTARGVRYTVPQKFVLSKAEDTLLIRFRVDNEYKDITLGVKVGENVIKSVKKRMVAPGEMQELRLKKSDLEAFPDMSEITVGFLD